MANIIFSGDRLRALRQAIQLNTAGATIASGSADPTSVAPGISLSPGSIYLSTSTGKLYVKKTSTGDDTNFDIIPQLSATLTANRVVVTSSTGAIVTDAELTYDSATDTFTVVNVSATDVTVSSIAASSLVKTDGASKLVAGTVVNADVDAAAAIALTKLATTTADRALQSDGSGVISASSVTATELGYVSGVTSAIQTQLGDKVNKAGDSMTGDLVMGGNKITSLGAPTAAGDAANKTYVDAAISGLAWKNPVRALAASAITLSGAQTIDGVSIVAGNRVLVTAQASAINNGIYVAAAGAWARASDMAAASDASSTAVFVQEGTVYADTAHTCTSDTAVVGTDALTFTQFAGGPGLQAGVGLILTGNVLDVNLGAGIAQLPTDEVGIDLRTDSGLMLTDDGTTPSSANTAQLVVRLDGTTLARSASGTKVADQGITNTQVSNSAAIAYSKLDLANSIVNADIATGAAIARSKLATDTVNSFATNNGSGVLSATAVTASRAVATDANGLPIAATTTAAELDFVSGVTSAIQTQLNAKLNLAGGTMTGAIDMGTNKITSLGTPTANTDAATKGYVDGLLTTDFSDATFRISDNGDLTKKIAFEAAAITTGTVRTVTMPDTNVDLGLVATAIQRAGTVAFTADQPMGTFKLTGLGAGTTAGDSVRYEQAILTSGANAFAADQSVGGFKLTSLATPTTGTDAANKTYVDAGDTTGSSNLTLGSGGTITASTTHTNQVIRVQASGVGTTVLSTTPFGAFAGKDGQLITLIGSSTSNLVQINNNDITNGTVMNAEWVGGTNDSITFIYSSALTRFIEISRNN